MSPYLSHQPTAHPLVDLRPDAVVTAVHGDRRLVQVTVSDENSRDGAPKPWQGLFGLLGVDPVAAWLQDVALQDDGFVRADNDVEPRWAVVGARPPAAALKTNILGVLAAGDVPRGLL